MYFINYLILLKKELNSFSLKVEEVDDRLEVYLSVDGVSLTDSSLSQFWTIVGFIPSLGENASVF